MAVKKTGLGKGLDALFSTSPLSDDKEEEKVVEKIDESEKIHKIKITEIEPNKNQPRRNFNSESIDELAESIKRYGVIQPIIVSKKDNYYEIIAGERRWRASKKAGLTEMPCIIRESEEKENKEIALIENIQREDLNPIEKARSFRTLLDEYGLTQQELADTLGISRSALTNTVRLLNLDPRVIDLALEGKLTEGHCRSLVVVDDPDKQYEMALQVIENGDSVREVERMVKGKKQGKAKNTRNAKYEAIYKDIEDRFQGFFGTKVKLDAGRKKGKIILRFSGNDNYTIVDLYGNENEQYNEKSALNKINFTQLNDEIMNVITKENKVNDAGAKLIIAGIEQAENEALIAELENKVRYAKIIDESEIDTKTVQVGNTVKLLDVEFNEEVSYTIVGSTEVDLAQNRISNESPMGKALLGAKKNQTIEVQAPAGVIKYKVLSITK